MGFFRIASFCLAQPNYVPLSVFPQSTPEPTQFELKFMAETEKKKQAYLATRFPEACIFTDVADMKSCWARTSNGGAAAVPEAGWQRNSNHIEPTKNVLCLRLGNSKLIVSEDMTPVRWHDTSQVQWDDDDDDDGDDDDVDDDDDDDSDDDDDDGGGGGDDDS